jgi:hypothetical protein
MAVIAPERHKIETAAFYCYKRGGKLHGHDQADWFQGEQLVFFAENYLPVANHELRADQKQIVGPKANRRCRYCRADPFCHNVGQRKSFRKLSVAPSVSHVGKIYTLLTHHIAGQIDQRVQGVVEVYVWLCSQFGQPIKAPLIAAAQVVLQEGVGLPDVEPAIAAVIEQELAEIHEFG